MNDHVDSRPDQPDNTTDYHYSQTSKTTADFAHEAVAAANDYSEAETMLRDAADKVAEGGV